MSRKLGMVYTLALLALLTGCASVPMASMERDTAAKNFVVKSDKANIYVYRNETFGAAIKMPVALDGKLVGDTASKTYMVLEVSPGNHTIVSKTENDSTVVLDLAAGRNYYVWQEVKMGMFAARSALHEVDEATGRAGIAECKLIDAKQ